MPTVSLELTKTSHQPTRPTPWESVDKIIEKWLDEPYERGRSRAIDSLTVAREARGGK